MNGLVITCGVNIEKSIETNIKNIYEREKVTSDQMTFCDCILT